jgi:hypothetical protein
VIIQLSATAPPRLVDVDRLDRLHAECQGDPAAAMYDELCCPGPDEEHVWVSIAGLRAGVLAADPSASEQFAGVIAYATNKGWIDEPGTCVRAHIASSA